MRSADRRRLTMIVVGSGIAHLGMFALLAANPPRLRQGDVPPIFAVEVVPFVLPPRSAPPQDLSSRPLHPRRAFGVDETTRVAPLVTPSAPAPQDDPRFVPAPSPAPADGSLALRNALRSSPVGCANLNLLARDERQGCLEKLGARAEDTPFIPPPLAKDRLRGFDEKVAAQEQMRIYRRTNIYPGMREALRAAR